MSLKKYQEKRDFTKTTEPLSLEKDKPAKLNFCVQKHDARNLHYDFRLEFRGVLLSWAVPKGPSLDPKDKRLAIHVEDHPLEYQYFEGVIPKGNYGAGTVEIWDHGYYTLHETDDAKSIEKYISAGLKKGHIAFLLHGEKLNGEFVLQKLKPDPDDNSWLLIKKTDQYLETTEPRKKKVLKDS
jgi:bifunctional non-homologous end joining protein LigD